MKKAKHWNHIRAPATIAFAHNENLDADTNDPRATAATSDDSNSS